jgi:hypothetical protein
MNVELRNAHERVLRELPASNREFTEHEKEVHNHEMMMYDLSYSEKFAKLMHKLKYATYIQYRDYFATVDFFINYHGCVRNENILQKIMRRYRDLVQGRITWEFAINHDILRFYQRRTDDLLLYNPHASHIYGCSIPAYVEYCLLEIAKRRGLLATIYETNAKTRCESCVGCVFADEVVVATIARFL